MARKRPYLGLPQLPAPAAGATVGRPQTAKGVSYAPNVAVELDAQGRPTRFVTTQNFLAPGVNLGVGQQVTLDQTGHAVSLGPIKPPGSGAAPPAASGGPAAAAAPFGDDAQAAAARAQALFDRNQQIARLQQQGAYDANDLAETLRRMGLQLPKDLQSTREGANRQGLFYSGILGKRLGDVQTDYARREADQRDAYQRREAARLAALDAIAQGAPLTDAAITAAEIDRQTARDVAAAGTGSLAPNPEPAATAAAADPVVKTVTDYTAPSGTVGTLRIHQSGKRTFTKGK